MSLKKTEKISRQLMQIIDQQIRNSFLDSEEAMEAVRCYRKKEEVGLTPAGKKRALKRFDAATDCLINLKDLLDDCIVEMDHVAGPLEDGREVIWQGPRKRIRT